MLHKQQNHARICVELVYGTSQTDWIPCGQEEEAEGSDGQKTTSGWFLDFIWHIKFLEWKQVLLQGWFVSSVETSPT